MPMSFMLALTGFRALTEVRSAFPRHHSVSWGRAVVDLGGETPT